MLKSKKLDLMTVTLHFTEVLQTTEIFINKPLHKENSLSLIGKGSIVSSN
jgi:hypothetical protein